MGRLSSFGQHLYTGRVSVDFVGRRRLWYAISVVIILVSTLGFVVQGFNLGIGERAVDQSGPARTRTGGRA